MKEKVAVIAIFANVSMAGGKIAVGIFSNSAAVLAAGVDSFVDIFSSSISYAGMRIAAKPADKKHPYGHYKFEVLAGVAIALIVLATGVGIIYDALANFFEPREFQIGYLAFGVMAFSAILNESMARLKIYYGKKENSVSLLSDGVHSRIDFYTSLAVLGGLFLTGYWVHADAVLAILMGLYIMKEAVVVGKDATGSLLDVSAGEEVEGEIRSVAKEEGAEIKNLKTQKKGSAVTANLEIKLPNHLRIEEATKISNALRDKLLKKIESLQYVVIEIASHEIESGFYRPGIGKGFGWQKKIGTKIATGKVGEKGPQGDCVCPKCGRRIPHERGVPCASLECPDCKINLERK